MKYGTLARMNVPIRYDVDLSDTRRHQVHVDVAVDPPASGPMDLVLPCVSPGSPVNSRNHAQYLSNLTVTDAHGAPVPYTKLADGQWRVQATEGTPVRVGYDLAADRFASVQNQLNDHHAYLNGAATFMYVRDHDRDWPSVVTIHGVSNPSWQASSTLPRVLGTATSWYSPNFQELADSNLEVGDFQTASAVVDGTHVEVVQEGHSPWTRLSDNEVSPAQTLADFVPLWRTFNTIFGPFPTQRYTFTPAPPAGVEDMNRYVIHKHYLDSDAPLALGLEHYHGQDLTFDAMFEDSIHRLYQDSARVAERHDLAHELGHKLLAKYVQHDHIDDSDFAREQSTDGLWFTEGVTEWLASVLELRSGLLSPDQYVKRVESTINAYQQSYQSDPSNARESSLSASQGNSGYYTKGSALGVALDLDILHLTDGRKSLLDVLKILKSEFGGTGKFYTLDDIQHAVEKTVGPEGKSEVASFFNDYLRDRKPIDFSKYLGYAGYNVEQKTDAWPIERLPLGDTCLVTDARGYPARLETPAGNLGPARIPAAGVTLQGPRLQVLGVTPGGPAERAGLAAGDTVTAFGVGPTPASGTSDVSNATCLSFQVKRHDAFTGQDAEQTIVVPLQPASRSVVAAGPSTPIREAWLQSPA